MMNRMNRRIPPASQGSIGRPQPDTQTALSHQHHQQYLHHVQQPQQARSQSHSHPSSASPPTSSSLGAPEPRIRAASDTIDAASTPTAPTSIATFINPLRAHPPDLPKQPQEQGRKQSASNSNSSATPARSRQGSISQPLTYPIRVKPNSLPSELVYPDDWAPARDVRFQDWATFVGCLIPNGGQVTKDATSLTRDRRRAVEATISDWNDGFFRRRGVKVYLDDDATGSESMVTPTAPKSSQNVSSHDIPRTDSPASTRRSSSSLAPSSSVSSRSSSVYSSPDSQHAEPVMPSCDPPPASSSKGRPAPKLQAKDVCWSSDLVRAGNSVKVGPDGLIKFGGLALDDRGVNHGSNYVTEPPSMRSFFEERGEGHQSHLNDQQQYPRPSESENALLVHGQLPNRRTSEPSDVRCSWPHPSQFTYGVRAPAPQDAQIPHAELAQQQQPRSHTSRSVWRRSSGGSRMAQQYAISNGPTPDHRTQDTGAIGMAQ